MMRQVIGMILEETDYRTYILKSIGEWYVCFILQWIIYVLKPSVNIVMIEIMKKILRLLLIVSLFYILWCSVGQMKEDYQNSGDSIKLDSTKLYFGKVYAIDKLPLDVYEYVPKDTLDMWLPIFEAIYEYDKYCTSDNLSE